MKYTTADLFSFMDSEREVKVTCIDGKTFSGKCWAYSAIQNQEEYGDGSLGDSLDMGSGVIIYAEDIEKIEYLDSMVGKAT